MNKKMSISIQVPGSTANLGPGFDTVALALGIYLKLTLTLLPDGNDKMPLIITSGPNGESLGENACAFVLKILKDYLKLEQSVLHRMRVSIESQIPIARGLGSSAAVVIAILYAVNKLTGLNIDCNKLLSEATEIEGHAENAAASLLGSFTVVARSNDEQAILAHKIAWPKKWHPILVIPDRQVSTKESRQLLPNSVSYKDAIHNLQRTALLLAAIQAQDDQLLQESLHDQLHEKYRSPLVPELEQLRQVLRDAPSLGCALSGAGSSILVLVHKDKKTDVLKQIAHWQKDQHPQCKILDLTVNLDGLKELSSVNTLD